MAKHIVYRGFGIRDLVDFTLLVNKKGKEIDWLNFLFDMTIPSDIEFVKNENSFLRYIRFLFPKVDSMSDTYNYAKKYKALKLLAWGHHFKIRKITLLCNILFEYIMLILFIR